MAARRQGRWDPIGLFEDAQSWLLVFLVGITIGFAASWIDIVAAWLTDVRMGFCGTDWYLPKNVCCTGIHDRDGGCDDWWDWGYAIFGIRHLYPIKWVFYVAISTILAGSCTVLVCQLAPYAAGSGSPEIKTILGGFIIKGYLGIETLVIKLVGLPLAVSSGLAIGKEGPMIHVACCIGNIFPRFFPKYARNEARKREILSAAAATGVGVAFGAPIGGVLFSLEELSSYFPSKTLLRSYFCALVGSVTLQVVDPYRGKRVMYQVTYTRNWHYFELIFFVVLGVFGGLSGALFIRLNMLAQAYRQSSWLKNYPMREVVSIAMATAALCYFDIFTRVDSSELLEYLFKECNESDFFGICDKSTTASTIFLLVFALLLRISLSIITFGVKVPAGIFIPSMVWGALFGRMLGIIVESWQQAHKTFPLFSTCHPEEPCVTPGMYALLGAIAALGGVTRLTLSLTVIMFELTGTLDYIIPCMVTLMVTKLVGDFFGKGGLTDILIRWKQYPYLDPHDEELIGLSAEKVMTPASELVCLTGTGMTVDIIGKYLTKTRCLVSIIVLDRLLHEMDFKGFPVIQSTEDKILIGYISRTDLRNTLG
ncbi:chloride channel, partial [Cladochytrium replicatum]